jgi:hypothetical protein
VFSNDPFGLVLIEPSFTVLAFFQKGGRKALNSGIIGGLFVDNTSHMSDQESAALFSVLTNSESFIDNNLS